MRGRRGRVGAPVAPDATLNDAGRRGRAAAPDRRAHTIPASRRALADGAADRPRLRAGPADDAQRGRWRRDATADVVVRTHGGRPQDRVTGRRNRGLDRRPTGGASGRTLAAIFVCAVAVALARAADVPTMSHAAGSVPPGNVMSAIEMSAAHLACANGLSHGDPCWHSALHLPGVQVQPPLLDFGTVAACYPASMSVTLRSALPNDQVRLHNISNTSRHLHVGIVNQTVFSVVFLPYTIGYIEAALVVQTSHGNLLYHVFGIAKENPYRFRPLTDLRVPVAQHPVSVPLRMYNHQSRTIRVTSITAVHGNLSLDYCPQHRSESAACTFEPRALLPLETVDLARIRVPSARPSIVGGFIRLDMSPPDPFLVPVSVRVITNGIYLCPPNAVLDFGTVTELGANASSTVRIASIGAPLAARAVRIVLPEPNVLGISAQLVDPGTLSAAERSDSPATAGSTGQGRDDNRDSAGDAVGHAEDPCASGQIVRATFSAVRRGVFSGRITLSVPGDDAGQLSVPFRAHVMFGSLALAPGHDTILLTGRKNRTEQVSVRVANHFRVSVILHAVSVRGTDDMPVSLAGFELQAIAPGGTSRDIVLLVRRPKARSAQPPPLPHTVHLTLRTSHGLFSLPLRIFDGTLRASLAAGPPNRLLNISMGLHFGKLATNQTRSVFITLSNNNPVAVPIRRYSSSVADVTLRPVPVPATDATDAREAQAEEHDASKVSVAPGGNVTFEVTLSSGTTARRVAGEMQLRTAHQVLRIPVHAETVQGSLMLAPVLTVTEPVAPGVVVRSPLFVLSSFSHSVHVARWHSTNRQIQPVFVNRTITISSGLLLDMYHRANASLSAENATTDPRSRPQDRAIIYALHEQRVSPLAYIEFDGTHTQRYLPMGQGIDAPMSKKSLESFGAHASAFASSAAPSGLYHSMLDKRITLTIDMDCCSGVSTRVAATLVWPSLVLGGNSHVLPRSHVFNAASGAVTVRNPTVWPLAVRLVTADQLVAEVGAANVSFIAAHAGLGRTDGGHQRYNGSHAVPSVAHVRRLILERRGATNASIGGASENLLSHTCCMTRKQRRLQGYFAILPVPTSATDGHRASHARWPHADGGDGPLCGMPTAGCRAGCRAGCDDRGHDDSNDHDDDDDDDEEEEEEDDDTLGNPSCCDGVGANSETTVVAPGGQVALPFHFCALSRGDFISVLFVLNNLTVLEPVAVMAAAGRSELSLSMMHDPASSVKATPDVAEASEWPLTERHHALHIAISRKRLAVCTQPASAANASGALAFSTDLLIGNSGDAAVDIDNVSLAWNPTHSHCAESVFRLVHPESLMDLRLGPGESRPLTINFTPDFASVTVYQAVILHTRQLGRLAVVLSGSVPPDMLSVCAAATGRTAGYSWGLRIAGAVLLASLAVAARTAVGRCLGRAVMPLLAAVDTLSGPRRAAKESSMRSTLVPSRLPDDAHAWPDSMRHRQRSGKARAEPGTLLQRRPPAADTVESAARRDGESRAGHDVRQRSADAPPHGAGAYRSQSTETPGTAREHVASRSESATDSGEDVSLDQRKRQHPPPQRLEKGPLPSAGAPLRHQQRGAHGPPQVAPSTHRPEHDSDIADIGERADTRPRLPGESWQGETTPLADGQQDDLSRHPDRPASRHLRQLSQPTIPVQSASETRTHISQPVGVAQVRAPEEQGTSDVRKECVEPHTVGSNGVAQKVESASAKHGATALALRTAGGLPAAVGTPARVRANSDSAARSRAYTAPLRGGLPGADDKTPVIPDCGSEENSNGSPTTAVMDTEIRELIERFSPKQAEELFEQLQARLQRPQRNRAPTSAMQAVLGTAGRAGPLGDTSANASAVRGGSPRPVDAPQALDSTSESGDSIIQQPQHPPMDAAGLSGGGAIIATAAAPGPPQDASLRRDAARRISPIGPPEQRHSRYAGDRAIGVASLPLAAVPILSDPLSATGLRDNSIAWSLLSLDDTSDTTVPRRSSMPASVAVPTLLDPVRDTYADMWADDGSFFSVLPILQGAHDPIATPTARSSFTEASWGAAAVAETHTVQAPDDNLSSVLPPSLAMQALADLPVPAPATPYNDFTASLSISPPPPPPPPHQHQPQAQAQPLMQLQWTSLAPERQQPEHQS